jgi:tRNA(fMet)-specific endonuclease VapC
MGPRYLLDTNICIYVRRRRPMEVLARFSRLKTGEAALSLITYGELMYGAARLNPPPARAAEQLQEFLDMIEILPLPIEAGRKYGEIRAFLESKGQTIGNNDLWIAAHAICADLIVVTNNEREFRRVPDLKIENWIR